MQNTYVMILFILSGCSGSGDICKGDSVPPGFPEGEWSTEDLFDPYIEPESRPPPVPATASITTTSVAITYTDDNGRTWVVVYTVVEERK